MTTMRPRSEEDEETRRFPANPPGSPPHAPDDTAVIPKIPARDDTAVMPRIAPSPVLSQTPISAVPPPHIVPPEALLPAPGSVMPPPGPGPLMPPPSPGSVMPPPNLGSVMPPPPNLGSIMPPPGPVVPVVAPARVAPPRPVPPPVNEATAMLPVIRTPETPDDLFSNDATMLTPRVITYDSEPGAPGYRGKHSDLIPLTEGSPARTVVRTVGEIMITLGLVLLLFAGYEIWGKAAIVSSHQADLDQQLAEQWGADPTVAPPTDGSPDPSASATPAGPPPPPPGGTLGRLYLPRLDKYWVVVEGVGDKDLEYAPGHYPNTAQPGEVGNFSVAGHRSPAIFWDLDKVHVGDAVVMETRDTFFVYRVVVANEIVAPTAVEVVAPVPNQPGATPSEAWLTITTCNPKWDNYQRLIVHAELQRTQPRSAGRPAELQE